MRAEEPVTHSGFTLYAKNVEGARKKKRGIYHFHKGKPEDPDLFPAQVPAGFEIHKAKKNPPILRKIRKPSAESLPARETKPGESYARDVDELEHNTAGDEPHDEPEPEGPGLIEDILPQTPGLDDHEPRVAIEKASPERHALAQAEANAAKIKRVARARLRYAKALDDCATARAVAQREKKELDDAIYACGVNA